MKKVTLAKFNGTLPAKMLAALCVLNCVGANSFANKAELQADLDIPQDVACGSAEGDKKCNQERPAVFATSPAAVMRTCSPPTPQGLIHDPVASVLCI